MNGIQRHRRSTIVSPARYIQDCHWSAFSGLVTIGCLLAFVAGYVNTICVVGVLQLPLTALTGSTSKMTIGFAQGRFDIALQFFLLIFSFTLGSSISAALVGGSSFRIQRHYGLVLILESILLAFGGFTEDVYVSLRTKWLSLSLGAYMICLGCGLQNGMCTTFSGAVIRTTHVTGTLTDIGLIIGQAIFYRRTRKHLWKLKILVPLYTSFCFGGLIGWFAYEAINEKAILLPCAITGCLGIGHISYCKIFLNLKLRKAKDQEIYNFNRSFTLLSETAVESNLPLDKQSSETDQADSGEEQNELENSTQTQDFLMPLTITVLDPTINQEETK